MKTVTIKVSAKDIGTRSEERDALSACMVARAVRRQGFPEATVAINYVYPSMDAAPLNLSDTVARKIQEWCDWCLGSSKVRKPKPFSFKLQVP